jgi:hypothetical protein
MVGKLFLRPAPVAPELAHGIPKRRHQDLL